MEPSMEAFFDEEWDSINKMFTNMNAETPFLFPISDHQAYNNGDIAIVDDHHQSLFSSNAFANPNSYYNSVSQESSPSSGNDNVFFSNVSYEHVDVTNNLLGNDRVPPIEFPRHQSDNNSPESMEFYVMDNINRSDIQNFPIFSDEAMEDILNLKEEIIINPKSGNADCDQTMETVSSSANQHKLKRKLNSPPDDHELSNGCSDNPKKKSRTQKSKRNVQPKKNKKIIDEGKNGDENEVINGGKDMQSSSPSMSEDDSTNDSQELSGGETSNPKGSKVKTKAIRGSATDPQSLYARKRRERINERLKLLQNLVPNGTKVDISTMLEEAVQYVKFMQLQIRLLSSDDLWMYAPIAYNGMDIGAYQRMFPSF